MITISENATPRTYKRMNPQCNCEKQEYQVFHSISDLQHKHDQCECWSVTKGETFLKPILAFLTFYLPFGYTCADLKFDPNPNSRFQKYIQSTKDNYSPNKGKVKSVYKYPNMRDRNKTHICSFRVKDVKWTTEILKTS